MRETGSIFLADYLKWTVLRHFHRDSSIRDTSNLRDKNVSHTNKSRETSIAKALSGCKPEITNNSLRSNN